ncbi:MAG: sugar phosphate isomerase/epimerase [Candidatus Hydrogenedentes bacterium]|nr:sugar phosphate isomerase/epimerase [Candidatus Hydrogenedentota bacterium]
MRIGFLSSFNEERIAFARKGGFGSVELLTGYFQGAPEYMPGKPDWKAKADKVNAAYAAADIRISCIGAFYLNHMDPTIEAQAKETVRNAILLAEYLAVGAVAGFAGRVVDQPLEASLPKFKEIWGEHARFADDHGVRIAFEPCPMGQYHTPSGGINCICTPVMYEKCLDSVSSTALGLEWDPSHLVGIFVDPVENLRKFGPRVYHVHAKGAKINKMNLAQYGFWHERTCEHCFPGLGDENWAEIIKELRRGGYHGDLNIEGWHDLVFRNPKDTAPSDVAVEKRGPVAPQLEDAGLIIALRHLQQYCPEGF